MTPGAGAARLFPALRSATVRTLDELRGFLAETGESRSPRLVSVEVRPEELPPYLPLLQPALQAAFHPATQAAFHPAAQAANR